MERKPIGGRPKVGQRVLLRRWYPGTQFRPRDYWEVGKVEIVRKREVVYRSCHGYELTVPFGDLFEVPRHWGKR